MRYVYIYVLLQRVLVGDILELVNSDLLQTEINFGRKNYNFTGSESFHFKIQELEDNLRDRSLHFLDLR